jgi:hypothetical protein
METLIEKLKEFVVSTDKTEPHPSGDKIYYNDLNHIYRSADNPTIRFTSGTGFIKKFFVPFDTDSIAKRYALKNNLDVETVKKTWADKSELGRTRGTITHGYAEDLCLHRSNPSEMPPPKKIPAETDEVTHAMQRQVDLACEQVLQSVDMLKTEAVIASLDDRVAGMIDLLAVHKASGRLCILDWKTNVKLSTSNRFQRGLPPICHLEETDLVKYSIQLGLYEHIIKSNGYCREIFDGKSEIVFKKLIHIRPDGFDLVDCLDLSSEIQAMLEYHRANLS